MKKPLDSEGLSLNQVLSLLGLRTSPALKHGCKNIHDKYGKILVTGHCCDVWLWLREAGRIV